MTVYKDDANLKALWSMDEATGATRLDYTPNNNDLADNNNVAQNAVDFKEGTASAEFTAASLMHLTITDVLQTGLDLTPPFSIVLWLKFHAAVGSTEGVLGKGNGAGNLQYQLYRQSSAPGVLRFRVSTDGLAWTSFDSDSGTAANVWMHVGVVLDGVDVRFYRNGASDTAAPIGFVAAIHNDTEDYIVGDRGHGAGVYLHGQIDELAIFNRALSSVEVNSIFTEGIATPSAAGAAVEAPAEQLPRDLMYIEQVTFTEPYRCTLVGGDDQRLEVYLTQRGLPKS